MGVTDPSYADVFYVGAEMKKTKSVSQIIYAHIFTYFNFLNIVLFVLILISGQLKNALFMGIVISNALIGIVQELRVKKLIDKLSVITATKARRISEDNEIEDILIEELKIGDKIKLITGDQIPCDGVVITSDGLEVDESMLTGESVPVHKNKGDELFSGSFVVAGSGVSEIIHVGEDNYAAKLVRKASTKKRASSEMQYAINRIIKIVSYALIPIGGTLFAIQYFRAHAGLSDSLVNTVAGVLGMIPEGLVLLTSISFILGVGRLARKKALVQEMEAIEALARVQTLCLDKTGTITTGELIVEKEVNLSNNNELVDNKLSENNSNIKNDMTAIMECMAYAFSDTNVTGKALKNFYKNTQKYEAKNTLPFSSKRKYMGITISDSTFVLGAPEFITGEKNTLEKANEYAEKGFRVLLLAKSDNLSETPEELEGVEPLMLIVLSDVVKDDAPDTLEFFKEMGVNIKIISGDNPATVSAVAMQAGLDGAEKYIDATTLPEDDETLKKVVNNYTVFGRVTPEMKNRIIKAYQSDSVVGMVGDGVNDVLALKEADCSIAMANGADAARQTAHIVLTDSNFSSMKEIVSEGRTIIANIERVSALYLTKTIYSVLLCVLFIIIGKEYPFIPIQLSLIGGIAIGIPSFLLALEKHEEPVISGFLKHVLRISLPGAILMVLVLSAIQIFAHVFGWSEILVSTMNLLSGGAISIGVLFFVCMPMNKQRLAMCVGLTALFVCACLLFPTFFGMIKLF